MKEDKGEIKEQSGDLKKRESKKMGFCGTNWEEQGSNTDRVRGVTPAGATHSQRV